MRLLLSAGMAVLCLISLSVDGQVVLNRVVLDTSQGTATFTFRLPSKDPMSVGLMVRSRSGSFRCIPPDSLQGDTGTLRSGARRKLVWRFGTACPQPGDTYVLTARGGKAPDEASLVDAIDTAQLRQRLETVAVIRDPGSPEGAKNLEQLRSGLVAGLAGFGFEVSVQPFHYGSFKGENIIAKKTGWLHPDSLVVLCASYDGMPGSPGANNNGSGVASIWEIAGLLQPCHFRNTVVVLATDYSGEEMIGSDNYVFKGGMQPRERVIGALDLDRIGSFDRKAGTHPVRQSMIDLFPANYSAIQADSARADFLRVVSNHASAPLARRFIQKARVMDPALTVYNEDYPGYGEFTRGDVSYIQFSDHIAFWYRKYPALWLTDARANGRKDGTADDVAAGIDYAFMRRVDRLTMGVLLDLAGLTAGAQYQGTF
jgi:hypothetical protein